MPVKIRHAFEHEYGKKKGDRIFYGWEHKHHLFHEANESRLKEHGEHSKKLGSALILKGNPVYINRMYKHLRSEHPSTRRRLSIFK